MSAPSPNWKATGNISPSVFVKFDTAKNEHVKVCSATTDLPIGISSEETFYPQGVGNYDGFAAHDGNTIKVYGLGETALLTLGVGGCTAGDLLGPDVNGNGVTVTVLGTTALTYGARALETGLAGDLARAVVTWGYVTAT